MNFHVKIPVKTHLAGVVDEPRSIAAHRGIYDEVIINAEHVATDSLALVVLLSLVRQRGSDQFTSVLDYHFTWRKRGKINI